MLVNLEINKSNLEKNLKIVRSINKNLICVIKDNAYGLGIENILPILLENKCDYFAVAYIEEAVKIQKLLENLKLKNQNGKIKVMALNYVKPENVGDAIRNNIELTVFNFSQLLDYLKILDEFFENMTLKIHIKVNSGMNRLGFNGSEILELIEKIKEWSQSDKTYTCRFGVEMLMTHFLDEDFKKEYLEMVANIHSEEYYVKMVIAWFFATALAKQWDYAAIYLENNRLDVWVHNKTIQKARESLRILEDKKGYLKGLKRKKEGELI